MSTKTVKKDVLRIHIPVDTVDIVNGPTASRCMEMLHDLQTYGKGTALLLFTFSTPASTEDFMRHVEIESVADVISGSFSFTGRFSGHNVAGVYDMEQKNGWLQPAAIRPS